MSDINVKEKIKPIKSPIAMLLLGKAKSGDDDECEGEECEHCGRMGCKSEHETESMGSSDDDEKPSLARRLAAREAFGKMRPYEYEYNDEAKSMGMPSGKVVGIMAQDMEKSEAGKEVVGEKEGRKWLDGPKAISLVLAGAADHETRLAELEKKRGR